MIHKTILYTFGLYFEWKGILMLMYSYNGILDMNLFLFNFVGTVATIFTLY